MPRLAGTWSWDRDAQAVTLEIRQVQPGAPFRVTVQVQLDGCAWGGSRDVVVAAGHEVEWAADWPRDPATRRSSRMRTEIIRW